jgi:hypothetical protein
MMALCTLCVSPPQVMTKSEWSPEMSKLQSEHFIVTLAVVMTYFLSASTSLSRARSAILMMEAEFL